MLANISPPGRRVRTTGLAEVTSVQPLRNTEQLHALIRSMLVSKLSAEDFRSVHTGSDLARAIERLVGV